MTLTLPNRTASSDAQGGDARQAGTQNAGVGESSPRAQGSGQGLGQAGGPGLGGGQGQGMQMTIPVLQSTSLEERGRLENMAQEATEELRRMEEEEKRKHGEGRSDGLRMRGVALELIFHASSRGRGLLSRVTCLCCVNETARLRRESTIDRHFPVHAFTCWRMTTHAVSNELIIPTSLVFCTSILLLTPPLTTCKPTDHYGADGVYPRS